MRELRKPAGGQSFRPVPGEWFKGLLSRRGSTGNER